MKLSQIKNLLVNEDERLSNDIHIIGTEEEFSKQLDELNEQWKSDFENEDDYEEQRDFETSTLKEYASQVRNGDRYGNVKNLLSRYFNK